MTSDIVNNVTEVVVQNAHQFLGGPLFEDLLKAYKIQVRGEVGADAVFAGSDPLPNATLATEGHGAVGKGPSAARVGRAG